MLGLVGRLLGLLVSSFFPFLFLLFASCDLWSCTNSWFSLLLLIMFEDCIQEEHLANTPLGFEFVLFGALGLLPTYSTSRGFSPQTAFNIIAILNAGSAFGRSFSGWISDKIGRYNTMIVTLILSLLTILVLWLPVKRESIVQFYIFAPLFGFGSGSIISMAPVCLGQLCGADKYGAYYGTSYSVVAFA